MTKDQLVHEIIQAIHCSSDHPSKQQILEYVLDERIDNFRNQFLIILKPECCDIKNGVNTVQILNKTFEIFEEMEIDIHSCFVFNGAYSQAYSTVEDQYSMLNNGARYGISSMFQHYKERITQEYPETCIMGAFEFLNQFKELFTIETLEQLAHEVGSAKVGNGTYLLHINVDGKKYGVINAFHPHQIKHFNRADSRIIVFDCLSNTDYERLAEDVVGFFKPENAKNGSLRSYLYNNKDSLNLKEVGTFYNGFHISPSPLEGMFGVLRYCNNENQIDLMVNNTNLGIKLKNIGLSDEQILGFKKNICCKENGKSQSIFDLFEGKNTEEIIEHLR
ncbi:hypothetical protein MHH60_14115 [Paenibacillus sp. FSL H7-0716]|uniref:Uncharacterized protein n=1 Tax=Paenibacillus odorifer TaxID=189426 RepID=A0AB36JH76_9BACL|nr:hypothetical protein [Paenibacillus odorifer]OME23552.1 hypothetical protein BSK47_03610 [Paenibacillus odorifer]